MDRDTLNACVFVVRLPVLRGPLVPGYGWAPVHWETSVRSDAVTSAVPGACFRRAGYRRLGQTTGRGAVRPEGHGHTVRVWVDTPPKIVFLSRPARADLPRAQLDPIRRGGAEGRWILTQTWRSCA